MAPPAVLGVVQAYATYRDGLRGSESDLVQAAQYVSEQNESLLEGARLVLTVLAAQDAVRRAVQPACAAALRDVLARVPAYDGLVVFDRDGSTLCADASDGFAIDDTNPRWRTAVIDADSFVLSEAFVSRLDRPTVMAGVPLHGPDGQVVGGVGVSIYVGSFIAFAPRGRWSQRVFVALADRDGELLQLTDSASPRTPTLAPATVATILNSPGGAVPVELPGAGRFLFGVQPLAGGRLHVLFGRPAEDILSGNRLRLAAEAAIPLAIWIVALATAWVAANRLVVRWVIYLQRLANAYASGRYSVRPRRLERAPEELRELGDSLHHLMETIEQRDRALLDSLDRREMLIKEIHHRVKNNLQIVASLLNLQARRVRDQQGREAIMAMRVRINALALVHRSLYEGDDLEHIELRGFLQALADPMRELMNVEAQPVDLAVDAPEVTVGADTAITLALFITEAITNAYKHAFRGRLVGHITVRLAFGDGPSAQLTIADDGVGGFSAADVDGGLGRTLMEGFARQLGGSLAIEEHDGTLVRLTLPVLR